jgi:uncharacterized protein YidB (DUF937 family)
VEDEKGGLRGGGLLARLVNTDNLTPEHIAIVFSTGELASLAQRMGMPQEAVADWMNAHLPAVLSHLSGAAPLPGSGNMLDTALALLRERLK